MMMARFNYVYAQIQKYGKEWLDWSMSKQLEESKVLLDNSNKFSNIINNVKIIENFKESKATIGNPQIVVK